MEYEIMVAALRKHICFFITYSITKEHKNYHKFITVRDYSFNHFSEQQYGEWYGYLNRDGSVSSSLKDGPYI